MCGVRKITSSAVKPVLLDSNVQQIIRINGDHMKIKFFAVLFSFICAVTTHAAGLECKSNTSQGLQSLVTVLKMKQKLPQEVLEPAQKAIASAQTCEEVEHVNLTLIGYALGNMP